MCEDTTRVLVKTQKKKIQLIFTQNSKILYIFFWTGEHDKATFQKNAFDNQEVFLMEFISLFKNNGFAWMLYFFFV